MDYISEYESVVAHIASEYHKKYPMLEAQDISQILWMWFVTHPSKYKEWSDLDQKDKDKLIAKSLRNAAITFCEKEKAKVVGYEFLDLYYYDATVIEAFLPSIITESYEIPSKIKDLNFKFGKGETTDGNNWLVLRSDIASGYYQLSEAKQKILKVRFSMENCEWDVVAEEIGSTAEGARKKVQRAISSLIRNLGGYRPSFENDKVDTDKNDD